VSLEERQECVFLVREAHESGARRIKCCELLGLSLRTLERWENNPEKEDGRQGPNSFPNALSLDERELIINVANSDEFKDLAPAKIVPKLSDQGKYIASESSFYRVLKGANLMAHRSKSSPHKSTPPEELRAENPNEVWSWDITYLKGPVKGKFYYLYLPMDLYSRMIVHWEIHEREDSDLAAGMIEEACRKNGIERGQINLHSDNGGPMKGATMLATLERLGVMPSFSRPGVSDDNPFSESLFKTLKYCPEYPSVPFASLEEAKKWVEKFVRWYNFEHLHSGIKFVTPASRHCGEDEEILRKRKEVYELAKNKFPGRWSRGTRNWNKITKVVLNPINEKKKAS
jgi:putative transposase